MTATAPTTATGHLTVTDLRKDFETRAEPLCVLDGVSFELAAGEAMVVMGPSGSGKSTLLHILGGLDRPTAGQVRVADIDPFALSESALARFRNQRIGFVFQEHYLLPQCSVLENVLMPTLAGGPSDAAAETRARTLLDRVGLSQRLDHRPAEISGGERQRAALARALINQPALVLCDEPTGNLDRATADEVAALLLELHRDAGVALVIVTHSHELGQRFPRRVELDRGRLQPIGGSQPT